MIDDIKVFLKGENISHDQASPTVGEVTAVIRVKKDDLKFNSKTDRYEVTVRIGGLEQTFMPNKTTMRNLLIGWGPDEANWLHKKVLLYSEKNVIDGKEKWVIKGQPSAN